VGVRFSVMLTLAMPGDLLAIQAVTPYSSSSCEKSGNAYQGRVGLPTNPRADAGRDGFLLDIWRLRTVFLQGQRICTPQIASLPGRGEREMQIRLRRFARTVEGNLRVLPLMRFRAHRSWNTCRKYG
jgi:hypothetical protein